MTKAKHPRRECLSLTTVLMHMCTLGMVVIQLLILLLGTDHLTCRGGLGFVVSFRDMRVSINFFVARSAHFFQNVTLGCMAKTLNQIIFCFPPTKSEYFFQLNSTIGERTASYHFDKADWLLYKQMCREKIQIQMMRNVADPILKFNEIAD